MEYEQAQQVQQKLVDVKRLLDAAGHACSDGNSALLVELLKQAATAINRIVAET